MTLRVVCCGGVPLGKAGAKKPLELNLHGDRPNVSLKLSDISASMLANVPEVLVDLLEVAAYVHAADQATLRGSSTDLGEAWRRSFRFHIPVRQPDVWARPAVTEALVELLAFLSDDNYEFIFTKQRGGVAGQRYLEGMGTSYQVDEVMLFSGGLDSLSGAIHEVFGEGRRVALVSHSSATKRVPMVQYLVQKLKEDAKSGSIQHIPVWATKDQKLGREYTQRARSFLYASLATTVSRLLGRDRIRFYENGVTSMNLPIAAQVVGGRATRTTHPLVIHRFTRFFSALLGRDFKVETPFIWKTKTDVVRLIRERGYASLIPHTVSCSRTIEATKDHPHCGRCSQCVDRRLATLAAQLPDELDPASIYDVDLLTGERPPGETRTMVEAFVQRARTLRRVTELDFLTHFPEAIRAIRHLGLPTDEATKQLVDLHRRHGHDVLAALNAGMEQHAEALAQRRLPDSCLLALAFPARYRQAQEDAPAKVPMFQLEGQIWRIWYPNKQVLLKDNAGLRYIKHLLASPQRSWKALELLAVANGEAPAHAPGTGSAMADFQALAQYQARAIEAEEEIEEAGAQGDGEQVAILKDEILALEKQLAASKGKGGKPRQMRDENERARQSISKAVTRSLNSLKSKHPELWRHLRSDLSTGGTMTYRPTEPISWVVSP